MENRENRVEVKMQSTLADGHFFFDGMVENISRSGLKVTGIPAKFDIHTRACTTIVSGRGKNFKLKVKPSWAQDNGLYKDVGFQILSSPVDWLLMLNDLDPREKDIWGNLH